MLHVYIVEFYMMSPWNDEDAVSRRFWHLYMQIPTGIPSPRLLISEILSLIVTDTCIIHCKSHIQSVFVLSSLVSSSARFLSFIIFEACFLSQMLLGAGRFTNIYPISDPNVGIWIFHTWSTCVCGYHVWSKLARIEPAAGPKHGPTYSQLVSATHQFSQLKAPDDSR